MIVTGVPSGDHECWCLLVTAEAFQKIKGEAPDEEFDAGPFAKKDSPYRYKIYPDDLIKTERGKATTISVECDITVPECRKE